MYNPFSLQGKNILVTGASSGIGRAVAIECSKMGAQVFITARHTERLNETYVSLEGGGHQIFVADLLKEDDIYGIEREISGNLDGIVNCAGINQLLPFQFVDRANLTSIFEINFFVPTLLTRLLVKKKRLSKNASIVFISSISGVYCSGVGASMYSATKGAINGMVKGMALDLAPKGIRVNCVNPGVVNTRIFESGTLTLEQLEQEKHKYPLKRFGNPEEVAFAVIYLLSDATRWITGTNLLIDGGFTLI